MRRSVPTLVVLSSRTLGREGEEEWRGVERDEGGEEKDGEGGRWGGREMGREGDGGGREMGREGKWLNEGKEGELKADLLVSCRHVYEGNIEIFRFCDVGLVACKVPHSSAQISIDPGSVCGGVVCGGVV